MNLCIHIFLNIRNHKLIKRQGSQGAQIGTIGVVEETASLRMQLKHNVLVCTHLLPYNVTRS